MRKKPDIDPAKLNEEVVKALPAPEKGNWVFYFPGAILQGMPAVQPPFCDPDLS